MKMKEHAAWLATLAGGTEAMGPATKTLYERFMQVAEEECIAPESQVDFLIYDAMSRDFAANPPSEG